MNTQRNVRRFRNADSREDDHERLKDTMTALIQEAYRQQKHGLASRLSSVAAQDRSREVPSPTVPGGGSPMLPESLHSLIREITPRRRVGDLVLNRIIKNEVRELVEEISQTALLRSHSLEPRHTVLLIGPPGTGKTSLAEAIATELAIPFLTVRYEGLVGSYLGETSGHLREIIQYASKIPCVLFFDEFESVGKERSDLQETGEIKRLVSSLLMHMDLLPSHCVVVCATNHPELLDRAVWRRFEVRLTLPVPGAVELKEWLVRTKKTFGDIEMSPDQFVDLFKGETFSEIEAVTLDARRKFILSKSSKSPAVAFKEAVAAWDRRRYISGTNVIGTETNRKDKPRTKASEVSKRKKEVYPPPALPL